MWKTLWKMWETLRTQQKIPVENLVEKVDNILHRGCQNNFLSGSGGRVIPDLPACILQERRYMGDQQFKPLTIARPFSV